MKPHLQEVHTRVMKNAFRDKIQNIAKIQPAVLDYIYAQLAFDRSAPTNPEMMQRLHLLCLGETGLLADLPHYNPGRPSGYFDVFFSKLIAHVEEMTAADDRRHGQAHMSEWLSLQDLMDKAVAQCPKGTPIPSTSKALVRLQFTPTNPYSHAALSFTSAIGVQRKIQRRQLQAQHPDDHYCNAQFKYLKHKYVELGDKAVLVCCDDKAKVKVGEPGAPVSTGVRGRESLAPVTSELCALDHDMTKASVTPSVILCVKQPNPSTEKSFVCGKVATTVNDSVLQPSSPFRHAAMLVKMFENDSLPIPNILLKYTDGGTDQRNTLEAVKCATICVFKELNLDMIIAARCAPGHSFRNPAERVMSILNIGLQNCATERKQTDEAAETLLKRCSSVSAIRSMAAKHPELQEKWRDSIEPVQSTIQNRFLRLKLKGEPMTAVDPVTDGELDNLKRHLRELFPTHDLQKLQKQHTEKNQAYVDWKLKHCSETHYALQVRRCSDDSCCLPAESSEDELSWLPAPVLDPTGEHFLPYDQLKGTVPTEKDRPSLKKCSSKKTATTDHPLFVSADTDDAVEPPVPSTSSNTEHTQNVSQSAQNARATAVCIECRKPRVVFCNRKLSQRQEILLATTLSETDYSCGSHLFPPAAELLVNNLAIKTQITCANPIELSYYAADLGRKDLCAYCGTQDAYTDAELKQKFKTVLPMCDPCMQEGKLPITQRPFGKKK
ncbi:hypothetical protein ACOMHN_039382 [Nucella lapillus]